MWIVLWPTVVLIATLLALVCLRNDQLMRGVWTMCSADSWRHAFIHKWSLHIHKTPETVADAQFTVAKNPIALGWTQCVIFEELSQFNRMKMHDVIALDWLQAFIMIVGESFWSPFNEICKVIQQSFDFLLAWQFLMGRKFVSWISVSYIFQVLIWI